MDLAIGAKSVFVMMNLFAKDGTAKIVPHLHVSADRAVVVCAGSTPSWRSSTSTPPTKAGFACWKRSGSQCVR